MIDSALFLVLTILAFGLFSSVELLRSHFTGTDDRISTLAAVFWGIHVFMCGFVYKESPKMRPEIYNQDITLNMFGVAVFGALSLYLD